MAYDAEISNFNIICMISSLILADSFPSYYLSVRFLQIDNLRETCMNLYIKENLKDDRMKNKYERHLNSLIRIKLKTIYFYIESNSITVKTFVSVYMYLRFPSRKQNNVSWI